ncbi:MAG: ribonuclease HII [Treponema sp.]
MNKLVCGIDEAGRGALAGPVYAAAVVLPDSFNLSVLDDSKKLSAKKREQARAYILREALYWHIGWVPAEQIDAINILQATLRAMRIAFEGVLQQHTTAPRSACHTIKLIVDGNQLPALPSGQEAVAEPKADSRYPSVMAASILAKTERDRCMYAYHLQYPVYRYDLHKGYGTALHQALIKQHGFSPIQRHSFRVS